jgi:transposase
VSKVNKIIQFPTQPTNSKLLCINCGAKGEMGCDCGAKYVRAVTYAAKVIADPANAGKSARKLAEETGLAHDTFSKARRKTGVANNTPVRVTGVDGKSYPANQPKKDGALKRRAAEYVLDQGMSMEKAAAKAGLDCSVQVMKTAVAQERGRREAQAELTEGAQRQQAREQEFECIVTERYQRALEAILPRLKEREVLAERIIASRKGLMDRRTYVRILARLHPDTGGAADLFDIFKQLETLLLTERECPTVRLVLPRTAAEWDERMRKGM